MVKLDSFSDPREVVTEVQYSHVFVTILGVAVFSCSCRELLVVFMCRLQTTP